MNIITSLKTDFNQKFKNNSFSFDYKWGNNVITIPKDEVIPPLKYLKEEKNFDFLMQVAASDFLKSHHVFEVVYELYSSRNNNRVRLRTEVREGERIKSIISIWKGANWFEREIYDMFGIEFEGHPYLKRLLTHHQFVGHPLRKDYRADKQQACKEALPIHFQDDQKDQEDQEGQREKKKEDDGKKNLLPLNIGPSHPATHGTLRIMCELDGEEVKRANVEIGYLHRCFEKMAETHPYNQVIPYTDRLNYCSAPMNNVGYCKTVEKLLGVEIPPRAQAMRVILCELSRVIDHIVCIGANAVDLGALTGFFHLFTYREKVYTLFEKLCGARLTVSMTRIGGMAQDAPKGWFDDVLTFCQEMKRGISDLEQLLSGNKIWIDRTKGVGSISSEEAIQWGYTGPCLRATGVGLDLRKAEPYYGYETLDFDIPIGTNGDVFDRYLVRVEEMKQSIKIIEQIVKNVPGGDYTLRDKNISLPEKKDVYGNIEGLMNHFMLVIHGLRPPEGAIYDYTEAANGELGFYLISDGTGNPYRLKVRPPCFAIYQSFPEQIKGALVADVISILGSMNVIAGELDR